jgi:hypothetical protein
MSNLIDFPLINPVKIFQQREFPATPASNVSQSAFNINYNNTPFDRDWYVNRLSEFEEKVEYLQPYQKGDKIWIQWRTEATTGFFRTYLLDCNGEDVSGPLFAVPQTVNGVTFYTLGIQLYSYPEGKYFIQIRHFDTVQTYFISEPIHLKEIHDNTILIEYWNSYNAYSVFFEQSGIRFQLRVPGEIKEMLPKSNREVYDDNNLSQTLLSARSYREWLFIIGANGEKVTQWLADKVSRSFDCDNNSTDGHFYTALGDGALEPNRLPGYPLSSWSMTLRDRDNNDTVIMSDLGYFNLGPLPETSRFYVKGFQYTQATFPPTVGNVTWELPFTGARNLIDFLNNTPFLDITGLIQGGEFTQNQEGDLIYLYSTQLEKATWEGMTAFPPALVGVLPYWNSVEVNSIASSLTDLEVLFTGVGNRAATYGDGATAPHGTGNLLHNYGPIGTAEAFIYYDTYTEIDIKSAGDYAISSLGGQISPVLEVLTSPSEIISNIKNDLFIFASGAFNSLDLSDNSLPVAQVDNILTMLRNAQINNRLTAPGQAVLNAQNPASPPSDGMEYPIQQLKKIFTITTD